jgi:hypothetical protein
MAVGAVNIAVGTLGLLSTLACLVFLAFVAVVWWRARTGENETEMKLLKSQFGMLFLHLIIAGAFRRAFHLTRVSNSADLISGFGFALCLAWASNGMSHLRRCAGFERCPGGRAPIAGVDEHATSTCTLQAVAITGGDLASGLFSLAISIHTCECDTCKGSS